MSKIDKAYEEGLRLNRKKDENTNVFLKLGFSNNKIVNAIGSYDGRHTATIDYQHDKCFCDCEDFKFTFYAACDNEGMVNGEYDLPEATGSRANNKPGFCKHLIEVYERVEDLNNHGKGLD